MKNLTTVAKTFVTIGAAILLLMGQASAHAQSQGKARVRVIHASPDAPAVDIYVDGTKAFSSVVYKGVTDYAEVTAGSRQIQVVPTGKTLAAGPVVVDTKVKVDAGEDYSIAAVGKLANIAPLVLTDDNTLPPDGKASVRFVHLSPDSPAVDVLVPATNLKLYANVAFKGVGKYTTLDAGQYNITVRTAGTSTSVLEVKGLQLESKTVYTVYAFGLSSGTPVLAAGRSTDAVVPAQVILPVTGGDFSDLWLVVRGR